MSVCVCLSVSALTAEPFDVWSPNLVQPTTGIDLDDISDEFDGQGHRSKVLQLKNVIF